MLPVAATPKTTLRPGRLVAAAGWVVMVGATKPSVTVSSIELEAEPRPLVTVTVHVPALAAVMLESTKLAVLTPCTTLLRRHW